MDLGSSSFDNGCLNVEAQLCFKPNPRLQRGRARSPYISTHGGVIVFPDHELAECIGHGLVGSLLNVQLERTGPTHYVAKAHTTLPLRADIRLQPRQEALDEILPELNVAVLIDGQNFANAIKNLSPAISPMKVIRMILQSFTCWQVKFYICWESALERGYLTPSEREEIEEAAEMGQMMIVNRQKKVILSARRQSAADRGRSKTDIDGLLIADAVEILCQQTQLLDGLVLFAGDSDYADIVSRWLGQDKHVYMISSRNSVSSELRQLAEANPLARIMLLEEIIVPALAESL